MPRPPNISIEATRSNGPSGAGTATSTTRKSTSFLSPARSPSARRISSRGFAVLGWRPRFPCSSWGYRDPARRSSSKYWPAIQKSPVRVRLPWSATPWPRWLNQTRTSSSALADWTARRPSVLLRGTWSGFAQRVAQALRVVDKTPENYLYLGLLASLFPRAKLIHCRRDLRDVAVSCWMTSFGSFRCWASDQQHIASRFHQYQRMMEHWRKFLPVPLLEVDYEETVADLEGVARKLVAWCGLAWEPSCLEFHKAKRPVSTASAVQVRQPVYTTSVGRWKHYEQSLATLLSAIPGGR